MNKQDIKDIMEIYSRARETFKYESNPYYSKGMIYMTEELALKNEKLKNEIISRYQCFHFNLLK